MNVISCYSGEAIEEISPVSFALEDDISPFPRIATAQRRLICPFWLDRSWRPSKRNKYVRCGEQSDDAQSGLRVSAADIPNAVLNWGQARHVCSIRLKWTKTDGYPLPLDELFEVGSKATGPVLQLLAVPRARKQILYFLRK
jgi:hypothetical protein